MKHRLSFVRKKLQNSFKNNTAARAQNSFAARPHDSLAAPSLTDLYLDSLMPWFRDSFVPWLLDSLIPWFLHSLVARFDSLIHDTGLLVLIPYVPLRPPGRWSFCPVIGIGFLY